MTIEQLEQMATNLYGESADAIPGTSMPDEDHWIAKRIEQAIQNKGPLLKKLQEAQGKEDVYNLLRDRYEEADDSDQYDDIEDRNDSDTLEPDDPAM